MSNLGMYQTMTTVAKKCGGPLKLMGLIAVGGYIAGKGVEKVVGDTKKAVSKHKKENKKISEMTYSVIKDGVSNEGIQFKIGDSIRVLAIDKDVVLIEKIGDTNNPYYVAMDFLCNITNYNNEK